MSSLIDYRIDNGLALIGPSRPPVNALGQPLRAQLAQACEQAASDPAVAASLDADLVAAAAGSRTRSRDLCRSTGHPAPSRSLDRQAAGGFRSGLLLHPQPYARALCG